MKEKVMMKGLMRSLLLGSCMALASAAHGQSTERVAQHAPVAIEQARTVERPRNIIFILVDDLRYDAMGFLTPGLRTPFIDQLARGGTHFQNAAVTSSLCSPSRATILTGMSPRNHGVIDNNVSTEDGLTFFPRYLQHAGYQTGFFGKWHMGYDNDEPRAGFDRWVSFRGQGTYFPTDLLPPEAVKAGKRQTLNVDGKRVDRKSYITNELTDYALDWLKNDRDKSKPFFLYLSHKAVHSDTATTEQYRDQYADLKITPPDTMADTPENRAGKPMWVQNQRNSWHGADFPYHSDTTPTELQRGVYRALSPIDDSLGQIMRYLKKAGIDRDTMIVFTSDNGFMFGDHGLIDKRNAYEGSVRVPLLLYAPGLVKAGATSEARVRNMDFAPTFLDLAGLKPPSQMEGKSFLPVATGDIASDQWDAGDFIYEYYWEWTFPHTPTTFAIRRGNLK